MYKLEEVRRTLAGEASSAWAYIIPRSLLLVTSECINYLLLSILYSILCYVNFCDPFYTWPTYLSICAENRI